MKYSFITLLAIVLASCVSLPNEQVALQPRDNYSGYSVVLRNGTFLAVSENNYFKLSICHFKSNEDQNLMLFMIGLTNKSDSLVRVTSANFVIESAGVSMQALEPEQVLELMFPTNSIFYSYRAMMEESRIRYRSNVIWPNDLRPSEQMNGLIGFPIIPGYSYCITITLAGLEFSKIYFLAS